MSFIKARIPAKSDIFDAYAACVFPISTWAMINVFMGMPSWQLRLNVWDIVGIVSYNLAFALLESILVFAFLLLIAVLVPGKYYSEKFVSITAIIVFVTAIWAVGVRFLTGSNLTTTKLMTLIILVIGYLLVLGISYIRVQRSERFEKSINNFVSRIAVLSSIYIFFGLVGFVVVLIRNIF